MNKKLTALPILTTPTLTDLLYVVSNQTSYQTTPAYLQGILTGLLALAPTADARNVVTPGGVVGQIIQGKQVKPLLALLGAAVGSYPYNTMLFFDRTWDDVVNVPTDSNRFAQSFVLRATDGGTYNNSGAFPGQGNTNHIAFYADMYATTPTQLIVFGYSVRQYGMGDAGYAAGDTQIYGEGLIRGIEYTTKLGDLQAQATLVGGAANDTVLHYTSAINENTFGVGRILIDTDIAYNTGTVSITRGSATVTGAGGASWTASVVGQYFCLVRDDRTLGGATGHAWYKITARPDATTLTLETPYGYTTGSGLTYAISPGVEVTAFDTTAKTITVKANSIAWANGHHVQMRIHLFAQITPFVGIQARSLPYVGGVNASFVATQLPTSGGERVGYGFKMAAGVYAGGLSLGGSDTDVEIGIEGGATNVSGNHFMTLPLNKRITFGSTQPQSDVSSPCLVGNSSADVDYMFENTVKGSFKAGGGLYARNTDGATKLLELRKSGNVLAVQVATDGVFFPVQAATASAPSYVKGGMYFDTTLNKLRIGGANGWETVTSV